MLNEGCSACRQTVARDRATPEQAREASVVGHGEERTGDDLTAARREGTGMRRHGVQTQGWQDEILEQRRHRPGAEHHRVGAAGQGDATLGLECLLGCLHSRVIGRKIAPMGGSAAPGAAALRQREVAVYSREQACGGIARQYPLRITDYQMLFLAPYLALHD